MIRGLNGIGTSIGSILGQEVGCDGWFWDHKGDAFAGGGLALGTTFVVEGLEGAAMWLPPGVQPDAEVMMRIIDENVNDQAPDLLSVLEQMSGFHPSEACWYLPLIGVDPAWQGRGLGAQLMRHATMRCDSEGTVAYLESSNPRNISLYLRRLIADHPGSSTVDSRTP